MFYVELVTPVFTTDGDNVKVSVAVKFIEYEKILRAGAKTSGVPVSELRTSIQATIKKAVLSETGFIDDLDRMSEC